MHAVGFRGQEARFDAPEAAQSPLGRDQLLDQAAFAVVGRLVVRLEGLVEVVEQFLAFPAEDDGAAEEAVPDCVLR